MRPFITLLWIILILASCSPAKEVKKMSSIVPGQLRLIDQFTIPHGSTFQETVVGGLSGIDYNKASDEYYIICDDPSTRGPARFYTAKIDLSSDGIDSVRITAMTTLLDRNNQLFPDINKDRIHSADVEAMRYDALRDEFIWSSEGQRHLRNGSRELQDPAIVIMNREGRFKDSFQLPGNMHIHSEELGPRHNEVFEGLSFDQDFRHVFVAIEQPLYEDGARAGEGDSTGWVRILKFNRNLKQCVKQMAYEIDAVPFPANPRNAFKINGISDILYIGSNRFLVVERGYSTGRVPSDVRVYLADATDAEDITGIMLSNYTPRNPVRKKLLLDFNTLGVFVDNVEGVCLGPTLANGNQSLIFVTDDNFASHQKTQFFLFEVLPD